MKEIPMTKRKHKSARSRHIGVIAAAVGLAVALSTAIVKWEGSEPQEVDLSMVQRGFPFYLNEDEAKPFPQTIAPEQFSTRHVSHAYRVAKEIPEVLVQQPCFCECRTYGHRSLLSCYTSGHAAGCTICIQEALLAERFTAQGKTPSEIRNAIIRGMWRSQKLD